MAKKLPEVGGQFTQEIVEALLPDLNEDQKRRVVNLFNHAFDHPWSDEDLKASIVGNICNEFDIQIPEEYAEG